MRRPARPLVAFASLAIAVAGCSSATGVPPGAISIVASTNVWGDVAAQIAGRLLGRKVVVTSFIDNPSTDPHSFEASTRNELAIAHADLILENGGGYDDFMQTLRSSVGGSATLLDAVRVSGIKPVNGSLNEHVWYEIQTVADMAVRIEAFLVEHDRAHAATYQANAQRFRQQLAALRTTELRIKETHPGEGVAVTEPVPLYMLHACGLVDRTPPEYSKAVEDGTDVSPRVLHQTLALFTAHRVRALVYNAQTTGPQTDQVKAAAAANGVPIVPVTETLPTGKTYYSWMRGQLDALSAALG